MLLELRSIVSSVLWVHTPCLFSCVIVTFTCTCRVDGAPIHFDEVEVHHVFSYPKLHLFEVLGSRYISEGVLRVGWILGSLGILGSPMALARRLRAGVRDLIMLPYEGIALGPTAFLSGVGSGASSFLRHISAGALTSVANVANR